MSKYRVDHKSANEPTVSTIAIDATDEVSHTQSYKLNIRHGRDWKPSSGERKGFMPNVCSHAGDSFQNGDFFPGEDDAAYSKAVEQGNEILFRMQLALDADVARVQKLSLEREQEYQNQQG